MFTFCQREGWRQRPFTVAANRCRAEQRLAIVDFYLRIGFRRAGEGGATVIGGVTRENS